MPFHIRTTFYVLFLKAKKWFLSHNYPLLNPHTQYEITFSFTLFSLISSPSSSLPLNQTTLFLPHFINIIKFCVMGANISTNDDHDHGDYISLPYAKTSLDDIPESCISSMMMRFDPQEICKLARVNRTFHRASLADFVWESKLPSSYKFLVNKVLGEEKLCSMTKKQIYSKLCQHNFFDSGTKEVWVDRCSGQICLFISSKSLKITGIDDRRYWNYIPTEESRFKSVAYLQQMWWVEVLGELEFEFPKGNYSVFFKLQLGKPAKRLGRRMCNLEQVHGWDIKPVRFQLTTSDGQSSLSQSYLRGSGEWVYYHVGDFVVERPNGPINIKFSLAQIDCTHTKGGLCMDGAVICPMEMEDKLKQF